MYSNEIYTLYKELLEKYGSPEKIWPQWCAKKKTEKDRELVVIGAILTQRTSWHNAHLALENLKKERLLSLKNIAKLPNLEKLTDLIRPAGFYQTKPKRLFILASFIVQEYENLDKLAKENVKIARNKLLNLYGIGPETADTILLYALDRPSFVIDEYTKRFVNKFFPYQKKFDYYNLKSFFEKNLPKKVEVYQNYHCLIIVESKGLKGSLMKIVK
ncbi:MAG: endonuclease [bacterium]|nr:endonuclease [bacterium]